MRILLVGGTWVTDNLLSDMKPAESSIVKKLEAAIRTCKALNESTKVGPEWTLDVYNGGRFENLTEIIQLAKHAAITIWMPHVPDNDLPKIRDVKAIAPHTILVTSKRNIDNKYSFGEIVRRALGTKSNLLIEFKNNPSNGHYSMNLIDPLGNSWFEGEDINAFTEALFDRAIDLTYITRQGTQHINGIIPIDITETEIDRFMDIVKNCAKVFNEYTPSANNTTRFLGNCSLAPTRCAKGFPSIRAANRILVSQRNVDKIHLTKENLVPVMFDESKTFTNQQILYCGNHKPSVDTPIQVRLYDALPNINYMIHSHCYIRNAPFTAKCIPCGGVEEVKEILTLIDKTLFRRETLYMAINLKGHGSIIMASDLALLDNITEQYYPREFPEKQYI